MKKTLVVVVAIAIGLFASVSSAQTPHVVVYFDNTMTQMDACCPAAPAGTVQQYLYVVANNFNMWVSGIEYMISYPTSLLFLGDIVDDGPGGTQLKIGQSVSGIGITWPLPANGFEPLLCQKASVLWMCEAGDPIADQLLVVLPFPSSGKVRAIRWPDEVEVLGVGLTSVVCPTVIPVEETTWGGIKALYDE
jgi:hypothetical protein